MSGSVGLPTSNPASLSHRPEHRVARGLRAVARLRRPVRLTCPSSPLQLVMRGFPWTDRLETLCDTGGFEGRSCALAGFLGSTHNQRGGFAGVTKLGARVLEVAQGEPSERIEGGGVCGASLLRPHGFYVPGL